MKIGDFRYRIIDTNEFPENTTSDIYLYHNIQLPRRDEIKQNNRLIIYWTVELTSGPIYIIPLAISTFFDEQEHKGVIVEKQLGLLTDIGVIEWWWDQTSDDSEIYNKRLTQSIIAMDIQ